MGYRRCVPGEPRALRPSAIDKYAFCCSTRAYRTGPVECLSPRRSSCPPDCIAKSITRLKRPHRAAPLPLPAQPGCRRAASSPSQSHAMLPQAREWRCGTGSLCTTTARMGFTPPTCRRSSPCGCYRVRLPVLAKLGECVGSWPPLARLPSTLGSDLGDWRRPQDHARCRESHCSCWPSSCLHHTAVTADPPPRTGWGRLRCPMLALRRSPAPALAP